MGNLIDIDKIKSKMKIDKSIRLQRINNMRHENSNTIKTCEICNKEKPISEFRKKSSNHGGYDHRCRLCRNDYLETRKRRIAGVTQDLSFKLCLLCKSYKKIEEFYVNTTSIDGRQAYCTECNKKYYENFRANPDNVIREKKRAQESHRRLKIDVFVHYGNKCECCGEENMKFLTIDHIDGAGSEHRRSLGLKSRDKSGAGAAFYRWLRKNKYPEGYRVLCYNCNCGRQSNGGVCPHKDSNA